MASWIRLLRTEIRKILIANNIRQSSWGSIDLGSEKEMNAGRERKRDAEFFGGSLPEHEMSMAGQFSPLLASSLLSIGCLFPQPFTPPTVFFPAEMDMFSSDQTPRSRTPPSGRANETTRYYYAAADPSKQWRRKKYPYTVNRMKNIWPGFLSVCYSAISRLDEPLEFQAGHARAARRRNDALLR